MDEKMMICPECAGSRKINNMDMVEIICPACNGTGKVSACIPVPSTPASVFPHKPDAACDIGFNCPTSEEPQVVCPACDGSGIDVGIETTGCSCCNGTGKVQAVPVPYDELLLEIGTLKYLTEIRSIIIKIQEDAISKCHQSEANIEEQLTEIVCSQYTRAEKAEARIKELEIQTQSYGDCDEAIRADQNKKIGEWGNEPCPHRNNDFPFPKAVPTELQMLKHECRDCWQEKFGIAKFQKGEEVE